MADLTIDEMALHAYASEIGGPVAHDLTRRIIKVQNVATRLVPVDTGRLRASIDHEIGVDGQGIYADCTANTDYALPVELNNRAYLRPALRAAAID